MCERSVSVANSSSAKGTGPVKRTRTPCSGLRFSEAAAAHDVLANEILHHAADALAIWLGGIVDLLEPEVIVVNPV